MRFHLLHFHAESAFTSRSSSLESQLFVRDPSTQRIIKASICPFVRRTRGFACNVVSNLWVHSWQWIVAYGEHRLRFPFVNRSVTSINRDLRLGRLGSLTRWTLMSASSDWCGRVTGMQVTKNTEQGKPRSGKSVWLWKGTTNVWPQLHGLELPHTFCRFDFLGFKSVFFTFFSFSYPVLTAASLTSPRLTAVSLIWLLPTCTHVTALYSHLLKSTYHTLKRSWTREGTHNRYREAEDLWGVADIKGDITSIVIGQAFVSSQAVGDGEIPASECRPSLRRLRLILYEIHGRQHALTSIPYATRARNYRPTTRNYRLSTEAFECRLFPNRLPWCRSRFLTWQICSASY